MMKLSRKVRMRIIMGIAIVLIGYGLLDRAFHFNVDPKIVNNVSMVIMIIAFALLFTRDQKSQEQEASGNDGNSGVDEISGEKGSPDRISEGQQNDGGIPGGTQGDNEILEDPQSDDGISGEQDGEKKDND